MDFTKIARQEPKRLTIVRLEREVEKLVFQTSVIYAAVIEIQGKEKKELSPQFPLKAKCMPPTHTKKGISKTV